MMVLTGTVCWHIVTHTAHVHTHTCAHSKVLLKEVNTVFGIMFAGIERRW